MYGMVAAISAGRLIGRFPFGLRQQEQVRTQCKHQGSAEEDRETGHVADEIHGLGTFQFSWTDPLILNRSHLSHIVNLKMT